MYFRSFRNLYTYTRTYVRTWEMTETGVPRCMYLAVVLRERQYIKMKFFYTDKLSLSQLISYWFMFKNKNQSPQSCNIHQLFN